MSGYVRKDTTNNIADGNVINAADLDSEFDGVQAAFNSSTGHTHDGTASEGAPITKLGPVQDVTVSTTVLGVKTTNTVDLGTSSLKFKDFYLAGAASIGGTLSVTGIATLTAQPILSSLTASQAVFTDASKGLVSNAITGTGNVVMSASPTLTGTITAAAANFSGAVAFNGTTTIGDADTDTITQAASYVTGTQLKSAKTATNTLSLAAYDVDGAAYTNLITLTASNTPTLALTSTGVGTINNMSIGATTASTGAFTTLSATGQLSNTRAAGLDSYINHVTTGINNTVMGFNNSGSTNGSGVTNNTAYIGSLNAYSTWVVGNGATIAKFVSTAQGDQGLAVTGVLTASSNLTITGFSTLTGGATIQGLTVGLGAGAVGTNTAVGVGAIAATASGTYATAIGYAALTALTSGLYNTAVGANSLVLNQGGSSNAALGVSALGANVSGNYNTGIGADALRFTTGSSNTGVGYQAGFSNNSGAQNVYIGPSSGYYNQTGTENTFVGFSANGNGTGGSAGSYNTAMGRAAMNNNYGSYNTAVGNGALQLNTSANNNTAVGYQAGYNNTATGGTFLGNQAGYYSTTGAYNVYVGNASGANSATSTGAENTAVGTAALNAITSGNYNVAVGRSALLSNTTASNNTAVGYQAGYYNTTGVNTFVGSQAGYSNSTGTFNAFIGGWDSTSYGAGGSNTNGSYNTALGAGSLAKNTTASNNTAVGYQAGYANQTGTRSVLIGATAGFAATALDGDTHIGYSAGSTQTTGFSNTFVGSRGNASNNLGAGKDLTTGTYNTFIGGSAGGFVTTGSKNTILGNYNGNQNSLDIRTASNYIVLSDGDGNPRFYSDGGGNLYAGTSNISFSINSTGGYSRFGSINATNVLQVAYNSTSSGVSLTSAATSWGTFSDQRLKNVTGVYENALSDIAQIEPIKFTWKSDESNKPCVGVLAHTVRAVVPEAVEEVANSMEDETLYLQVRYTELIPLMIASIKELKAEVDSLKSQLNGA